MNPIKDMHVAEPGLLVVEVAAADEDTAFAFQTAISQRWATATAERTTREVGKPGVRLRCYVDLRQELADPPQRVDDPTWSVWPDARLGRPHS
ncbi:DUF6207 family protein [Streptomyces hirsutus]